MIDNACTKFCWSYFTRGLNLKRTILLCPILKPFLLKYFSVTAPELLINEEPAGFQCLTGTVNQEFESGLVTYDNTKLQDCHYEQTECYQQTIVANIGEWPSKYFVTSTSLVMKLSFAGEPIFNNG